MITTPNHCSGLSVSPTRSMAQTIMNADSEVLSNDARAVPILLALTKKHR